MIAEVILIEAIFISLFAERNKKRAFLYSVLHFTSNRFQIDK